MSQVHENRPLTELIGGLVGDISGLFRKEIQLAKAEASEKVSEAMAGVVSLLIGGVLLLGALGVFLSAMVTLIASFLTAQGMDPILASSLSAAIVTVIVGIVGWTFVSKGLGALKTSNLNMDRTATSLGRDANIVKERL